MERMAFHQWSRHHALKIVVGDVGHVLATRMSSSVVIFLDSIDKVSETVRTGIGINETLVSVLPLLHSFKMHHLTLPPKDTRALMVKTGYCSDNMDIDTESPTCLAIQSPQLIADTCTHQQYTDGAQCYFFFSVVWDMNWELTLFCISCPCPWLCTLSLSQ